MSIINNIRTFDEALFLYDILTKDIQKEKDPQLLRMLKSTRVTVWNIISNIKYMHNAKRDTLEYFTNSQYKLVATYANKYLQEYTTNVQINK